MSTYSCSGENCFSWNPIHLARKWLDVQEDRFFFSLGKTVLQLVVEPAQLNIFFFQRVFGKQSGEIWNASMNDCVSGLDSTTSKVSTSRRPVHVGINASEKNQVILQPSPTLFKGSTQFKGGTYNHSTPRLQLPSLEFSSCTSCNAPFLRYEEQGQATVDLCVDISAR